MRYLILAVGLCCSCGAVQTSGEAGPAPTLTPEQAKEAQKKAPADLKTIIAFAKTYYAANNAWPSEGALGTDSSTAHTAPYRVAIISSTFPHWRTIEARGVASTGYVDVPAWIEPRHGADPWFAAALVGNLDGDSDLDVFTSDQAASIKHDANDLAAATF